MNICYSTTGQRDCESWWKERSGRITASRFGRIMSARGSDSLQKIYADMIKPPVQNQYVSAACRMGILEEDNAKRTYIEFKREVEGVTVTVESVGLCVPTWSPKIAASPDGIVHTSGEINPKILELSVCMTLTCILVPLSKSRHRGVQVFIATLWIMNSNYGKLISTIIRC